MANGIDYRIGPSNKTLEAMLKSDVPDIVTQAQEIIKSQGLENIDMGQNQLTQTMDPILQDVLQKRPEPEGIMKFADLANQYSNFMFQPRVGKFSISDALGIVSNNPYSMALTGITGAVQGLGALQDRFGIAGVPTVDQFGNLYTGEQLDKMNALGGYYSDPARQSRSRDRRIQSIFDRRVAGKSFSQKVLDDFKEVPVGDGMTFVVRPDGIMQPGPFTFYANPETSSTSIVIKFEPPFGPGIWCMIHSGTNFAPARQGDAT